MFVGNMEIKGKWEIPSAGGLLLTRGSKYRDLYLCGIEENLEVVWTIEVESVTLASTV